jgi:hypothetical protein
VAVVLEEAVSMAGVAMAAKFMLLEVGGGLLFVLQDHQFCQTARGVTVIMVK